MRRPMQNKVSSPNTQTGTSNCSRKSGTSPQRFTAHKIQPPSSGVVRGKQKAKKGVKKKEKKKKVNIYEQIRWTMRCQFNIKKGSNINGTE